jgi:Npun R1517
MQSNSLEHKKSSPHEVRVYECEIHLKFKLIEEKGTIGEQDLLLETLLDAFAYGADDYMEPMQVEVSAQEISEFQASPQMRRRLIRLRNSADLA